MNYDAFIHKFTTDRGLLIFVPTKKGQEDGRQIIKAVLKHWSPPDYFFHLQKGGHVAASLVHLSNPALARLDIRSFFDSVTRPKIHRALRKVGFSHKSAWETARVSTVRKPGATGFSLPFGFVQSPVLASIALDQSALGKALRAAAGEIRLAVYMDDILMSADGEEALARHVAALDAAAEEAGFELHPHKRQLGTVVEAFNLRLTTGEARVTDARMDQFAALERTKTGLREAAIVRYVEGINQDQAEELKTIYGAI